MDGGNGSRFGRRGFLRTAALAGAGALAGVGSGSEALCHLEQHRGELLVYDAYERYEYAVRYPPPTAVTVTLVADRGTDLDLYVTLDGREPTEDDYDRRSVDAGNVDEIELPPGELDEDTTLAVAVHSGFDKGGYRLTIEECEAGTADERARGPNLSLSDVRPVQTVTDTRLVKGGSNLRSVPDPDPVAGQHTGVLFDLEGTIRDLRVDHVVATVAHEHGGGTDRWSFWIRRKLLDRLVNGGADTAAVLDWLASHGGGQSPPVFRIREDTRSIGVALSVPGADRPFESATVRAGEQFRVRSLPPTTVGFLTVTDPGAGANYGDGDGRCLAYEESVDNALAYLRRVLPGEVAAYRHDDPIVGDPGDPVADYGRAYDRLDAVRSSASFPDGGSVTALGTDPATATARIRRHGFDAAVLVVPGNKLLNFGAGNYFGHHYDRRIYGYAVHDPKTAVASLETGGTMNLDYRSVHSIVHEVGHRFVDDPYRGPAPDHPLAQRDDTGTTATVDGQGVDFDHARHRLSNLDRDLDVDGPGLLSTALDLTDGSFSVVNGYRVGDGEFHSHGPRTTLSLGASRWPSYMSYTWRKPWPDARIQQGIVDRLAGD